MRRPIWLFSAVEALKRWIKPNPKVCFFVLGLNNMLLLFNLIFFEFFFIALFLFLAGEILSELVNFLDKSGASYSILYASDPKKSLQYPPHWAINRFLAESTSGKSSNTTTCDGVCQIKSSLLEGFFVVSSCLLELTIMLSLFAHLFVCYYYNLEHFTVFVLFFFISNPLSCK